MLGLHHEHYLEQLVLRQVSKVFYLSKDLAQKYLKIVIVVNYQLLLQVVLILGMRICKV